MPSLLVLKTSAYGNFNGVLVQVVERDLLLQEKEKLYKEMKDILARQVHTPLARDLLLSLRSVCSLPATKGAT